jgi:hypothetical protein
MSDSGSFGPRKTNPICDPAKPAGAAETVRSVSVRAYCGMGVPPMHEEESHLPTEPVPAEVGSAPGIHGRDGRATHGQDAHATRPADGGTASSAGGQLSETNPIGEGVSSLQREVSSARARACETNPISPAGRGPGGQNVRNEPNLAPGRPPPGDFCAKRTQFAPGGTKDHRQEPALSAANGPAGRSPHQQGRRGD